MLHSRRADGHIAWMQHLHLAAFHLMIANTVRGNQDLFALMSMPVIDDTRIKDHIVQARGASGINLLDNRRRRDVAFFSSLIEAPHVSYTKKSFQL